MFDKDTFKTEAEKVRSEAEEDRKNYYFALAQVAKDPHGREFLCRFLADLGAFSPTWNAKNARLVHNAVRRDVGQELLDDLAIAAGEEHDEIQRIMRVRRKLTAVEE